MGTVLSGPRRPAGTGTAGSKQRGVSQTELARAGEPRSAARTAVRTMPSRLFMDDRAYAAGAAGVKVARRCHASRKRGLPHVLPRHPVVRGRGEQRRLPATAGPALQQEVVAGGDLPPALDRPEDGFQLREECQAFPLSPPCDTTATPKGERRLERR